MESKYPFMNELSHLTLLFFLEINFYRMIQQFIICHHLETTAYFALNILEK